MTIRTLSVLAVTFVLAACGGGSGEGGGTGTAGMGRLTINALIVGEMLQSAQGQLYRGTVSCDRTVCSTTFYDGETVTVDLRDIEPSSPAVTVTGQQTRNGVQIGRFHATQGRLGFDTFGVWGTYNAATSSVGTELAEGVNVRFTMPVTLGMGTHSNPATGSATWMGAMVGVKVGGTSLGEEVTGDAEMTANFGAASLDLELTNIADSTGALSSDILWQGVPMHSGVFQAPGVHGLFYGPNHEEVGGVFELNGIAGAFSLARQ